jgi:hypothetical protein
MKSGFQQRLKHDENDNRVQIERIRYCRDSRRHTKMVYKDSQILDTLLNEWMIDEITVYKPGTQWRIRFFLHSFSSLPKQLIGFRFYFFHTW